MSEFQFDKGRRRVKECPCGKRNSDGKFVPYIGFMDKGYCHSCDRTFLPDIKHFKTETMPTFGKKEKEKDISFVQVELVERSMANYERNSFWNWLRELFGRDEAIALAERYKIGTSNHWEKCGASIFWYCDSNGSYRSGKIMLYGKDGHRVKEPFVHCNWIHTVSKMNDFHFSQCFFGEHLLSNQENSDKAVVIVESEKTAIIASVYFPNVIWLACGGSTGLTESKCSILKARNVVLHPDLGKFELWNKKAEDLRKICASVKVSDYLERQASDEDRQGGFDIADYLIRFPVSTFVEQKSASVETIQSQDCEIDSPQSIAMMGRYEFVEIILPFRFKGYEKYDGMKL